MYQMKKIRFRKIFLFGIIFSAVNALAADTLFIKFNNGNATETITKASFKKITFPSGSQMLVDKIDGSSSSFTIADVRTLRFGTYTATSAIGISDDVSIASRIIFNSTHNVLTVFNPSAKLCYVDVFNMQGNRLMQLEQDSFEMQLNVSKLPHGSYICRVTTNDKIVVAKFIK
jgi:hypothetical protein